MTLSIIGRCSKTGQMGIAISSSSIAVGALPPAAQQSRGGIDPKHHLTGAGAAHS